MSVRKREWTTPRGVKKYAWVVDYVDGQGARRMKTYAKKKDADAFEVKMKVEVRDGIHVADSASITVAEAGRLWILSGESNGLERSTIKQRSSHLKNHIEPLIGNSLLSKLTVPSVRDFEDSLRGSGRSPAMTKKILTSLGSIIADANERGLALRNPVRDIRGSRKGRERRSERRQKGRLIIGADIPSREEIKAFVSSLDGEWRPMLVTMVFTGIRSSEARGLRWQDVDLKKGIITIRQRVDEFGEFGPPKSEAGLRSIPVPPFVIDAIKAVKCPHDKGQKLVFSKGNGEPLTHSQTVKSGLIPSMIKAGVVTISNTLDRQNQQAKYTGLHSLRHFYASWLINRKEDGGLGLPAKVVQERLGHSSIIMTMDVYGHLFPQDDHGDELALAASALLG